MKPIRTVTVVGALNDDDLATILTAIRAIERQAPHEPITITLIDPSLSLDEAKAVLARIYPRIPGQQPDFRIVRRQ